MNDYQKQRFVERVISAMFNTISKKKIAVLGFAFKKDTGDTRETPAIDVCRGLMRDGANVSVLVMLSGHAPPPPSGCMQRQHRWQLCWPGRAVCVGGVRPC